MVSHLTEQVFLQEGDGRIELEIAIGLLLITVPFVLGDHIPYRSSVPLEGCHDLIGFAHGNAKLDRLTPSVKDLCSLLELFEKRGVALISVANRSTRPQPPAAS